MNTLVHADIFFFIASIGCVILFILGIIAMIMVVRILHRVQKISAKLESGVDALGSDVHAWLTDMRKTLIYRMLFGRRSRSK
ncbi:MAG TPA: hypothetical protein VG621_01860 [Candidatus Paceibacterota bacterium]|nr:hypothetical protein [Candidatus Paceibacterota bacterium]